MVALVLEGKFHAMFSATHEWPLIFARIIAIMLGRLRMSLDECQAAYTLLSETIFTPVHSSVDPRRVYKFLNAEGRFQTAPLEDSIKSTIVSLLLLRLHFSYWLYLRTVKLSLPVTLSADVSWSFHEGLALLEVDLLTHCP